MTSPCGLICCLQDWTDTFCITRSIQFLVSLIIVMFMIHDFIIRLFKQREFNFFFIVYLQMMVALICTSLQLLYEANCIFCLDIKIKALAYLQSYAYDIYFTTIVYQVARKLIQLKKGSKHFKWMFYTVHIILIALILFLTIRLILRNILIQQDCEESWFLLINLFEIIISVLMIIMGKVYTKFQQLKIEGMIQKNIKNPLPEVWQWIIINIVCQFFRFLRALLYIVLPYDCAFSNVNKYLTVLQTYTQNQILSLFFDVFSFHVGMVATIMFFRKKNIQDSISSKQFQSSIRQRINTQHSKQIQMQLTIKQRINKNLVVNQNQTEQQRLTGNLFIDTGGIQRESNYQNNKIPMFSI